jgi:3-hydroxybutyryl-CoA dehydrogenase
MIRHKLAHLERHGARAGFISAQEHGHHRRAGLAQRAPQPSLQQSCQRGFDSTHYNGSFLVDITHAVVIGTGTMAPGIAATLALAGASTTIVSRSGERAARAVSAARALLRQLEENELAAGPAAAAAADRLFSADDVDAAAGPADLVIESIVEDMALKKELFERLDRAVPPAAILASNTSGPSITEIARGTIRRGRVLTTHFWNPPHLMPLVEVVMGENTDEAVAMRTLALLREMGKTPVLLRKDRRGQLGNRIQAALMREAMNIVQEGIASAEDVDRAVRLGFGLRMPMWGPLEHIDAVGLDLVLTVQDYVLPDLNNQPRAPQLLRDKVARGELGQKSGRGFYDGGAHDLEARKKARDAFLIEFLRARRKS